MSGAKVGVLLRGWRERRRVSQLDLSLSVGVSARHLSFIETGRSRPSPEVLLALAQGLDIPLRECNTLLLAAGYAPRYPSRPLDDAALAPARRAVQRLLDLHDPYPGIAIDRCWNIVATNCAAAALVGDLPGELSGPPVNVYRVCLHPDGLAPRTVNFDEWSGYLLHQLRRTVAITDDPAVIALEAEVRGYPGVADAVARRSRALGSTPLLVPWELTTPQEQRLSLFTTLTTFGTPRDVTLDELAVELFYPADDDSAALLSRLDGGDQVSANSQSRS